MRQLREYTLEHWFVAEVNKRGGMCLKMNQFIGVPDRLVMFAGKPAVFVELKAKGGRLSEAQIAIHKRLAAKGYPVHVANSKEQLTEILNSICNSNRTNTK